MKEVKIKREGMVVHCYGEWREDSNCMALFDDERFDGPYIGEGEANWSEVVSKLAAYAKRNGVELVELQAC